jgi:hypothetical protein
MDKQKIKTIIEELKGMLTEIDMSEIDDKDIFHESVNIYIHESISAERKQNQQQPSSNEPTEKQISFLKKEKFKIPAGMTKQEASTVISEIIERKKLANTQQEDY